MTDTDLLFECEFSLAMINAGYDSINDTIINKVYHILSSNEYKEDPRTFRVIREYEKTLSLYGYSGNNIDMDELRDVYKKIKTYIKNINKARDFTYIKTIQRGLMVLNMNKRLKIRNKYIDYIENNLNKLKLS
jgi:hypothetical protein